MVVIVGHPQRAGYQHPISKLHAATAGEIVVARTLPLPREPVPRFWHGSTLLREQRGDSQVAALLTVDIGGTEAHELLALSDAMPPEQFGRASHLSKAKAR